MGLFDTYDTLPDNYIPNNRPVKKCCNSKFDSCFLTKPYEQYNAEGELIGYWWNYKDVLNLEFNITGNITVESNAIIYTVTEEAPLEDTEGEIDQKAYNIIDLRSWTCTDIIQEEETISYIWTEDEEFTYPEDGETNIYMSAADFLVDKQITVQLYNFRMEQIAIKTFAGNSRIIFPIDKELSEKMVRSNYYCTLTVWSGQDLNKTILSQEDCILTVK